MVMVTPSDPIGAGFVRSFARPGGNITGLTWQTLEAGPKRLQLLKETIPTLQRVAVLWDADAAEPTRRRQVKEAEAQCDWGDDSTVGPVASGSTRRIGHEVAFGVVTMNVRPQHR
jgi:hypothetical protein